MAISMDSTQNKLLLLFVFDKMEMPLSEQTILEMCCSANNWINYIDCKQALMQLIDANFVAAVNKGASNEAMYSITPEGRICLAHFFVRIPSSLREVVSDNVKLNRMNYKRKKEYASDYQKNPDGTYDVLLKIIEPNEPALEIKINVPNRTIAKHIDKKWEEKAAGAFRIIYDYLIE